MKKRLCILLIVLGINYINIYSQEARREFRTESTGFQWYTLSTNSRNWAGAADKNGRVIIPIGRYDVVMFMPIEKRTGFFVVEKYINGTYIKGACDLEGKEIIPCNYYGIYYDVTVDNFTYRTSVGGNWNRMSISLDERGRSSSSYASSSSSSSTSSRYNRTPSFSNPYGSFNYQMSQPDFSGLKYDSNASSSTTTTVNSTSSSKNSGSTSRQLTTKTCGVCHGTGTCNNCGGRGWVSRLSGKDGYCPSCRNHDGKCSSCGGRGSWKE